MSPRIEEEWFDELSFALLYEHHGGSGLSLALRDVEEMEIGRAIWWVNRLVQAREAEAKALKGE